MKIGDIVWVRFGLFSRLGKIIGQYNIEPYEYIVLFEKDVVRGVGIDRMSIASDGEAMLWQLENL